MGAGFSQVFQCFNPVNGASQSEPDTIWDENAPVDENLGHSFCYVRSSARFLSPTHSDRFISPSQSFRFDDPGQQKPPSKSLSQDTGFRAISGASVSANSSTPITVSQLVDTYDDTNEGPNHLSATSGTTRGFPAGIPKSSGNNVLLDGFQSTSSFSALPLQRLPRGADLSSGQQERTFFMSGPIERLAVSGPLECACSGDTGGGVPFSAPLGEIPSKRRKKKGMSRMRKTLSRNFSVAPVRNLVNRAGKDISSEIDDCKHALDIGCEGNVQWASGKAGEDRVHVVVSEELGWLFVGIYDGFNGPDAPEFLMSHLYKAMFRELEGLFWTTADAGIASDATNVSQNSSLFESRQEGESQIIKKMMFGGEEMEIRRRRLWEFLVDDHPEDGLDLSGSQRFSFTVDDALSVKNAGSAVSRRSLLLSKLKHGFLNRHVDKDTGRMFPWRFWSESKHKATDENRDSYIADLEMGRERTNGIDRKQKLHVVDHESVLRAMARALDKTEQAYLELTDSVLDRYPELALMGSCLLVVLMRDEDVYVMNLGDSRAIVAQLVPRRVTRGTEESVVGGTGELDNDGIVEECGIVNGKRDESVIQAHHHHHSMRLTARQLSTDHSTSIKEEVLRIKQEHPDDKNCIVNGRVKGRLKVTRAFGAGFLKQRKWNDSLLEMFRNDYIGTAPYISCVPSLHHHRLCPRDQFLVLSSDGLYQYFSNQEVISHVRHCMEKYPDGDPAQSLIEELLSRAARKAGMDFHDLLDIPQGDRRKYHDDVTVMVVSLEGRIWKSSGKYV